MQVTLTINGVDYTRDIEPRRLLVHFIRDDAELTGTHWGCDTSNCGVCTVLMDGRAVKSCTTLAVMAEGLELTTVEGLEVYGMLDPIQQAFTNEHALQCGFCTPGMMLAAKALLADNPNPTEQEIREGISGNLCRCTGYLNIIKAIQWAAAQNLTRARR